MKKVSNIRIEYEEDAVLAFAAEELKRYILSSAVPAEKIILGCSPQFLEAHGLGGKLRYDGYGIRVYEDAVVIGSLQPRGVLFGVYHLLEENGCQFLLTAGVVHTEPMPVALVKADEGIFNPDYEIRGIAHSCGYNSEDWVREAEKIFDIYAKWGINTIFLHQGMTETMPRQNAEVIEQVKRRGLRVEYGGHLAQNYVDRSLFDSHPEYFIERNGVRTPRGNFCTSNPEAMRLFCEGIRRFMATAKGIDVLHLWFDDVVEGSWCTCDACRGLSPLDQQERIIRKVYETLAEDFPDLEIDILLYHDTLENVGQIHADIPNTIGVFAPRERCYAHCLENGCDCNRYYYGLLKEAAKVFGDRVEVFEYYSDPILFSKCLTALGETIAQDLISYRRAGVKRIVNLTFGLYSNWAYGLNDYIFARHSFDTARSVEQTQREYIKLLPAPIEPLFRCYSHIADFSHKYFAFCGYNHDFSDIRKTKLCDYFPIHMELMRKGLQDLRMARKEAEEMQKTEDNEYLRALCNLIDVGLIEGEGLIKRMKVRWENFNKKDADKDELLALFAQVKDGLYKIIDIFKANRKYIGVQYDDIFVEHLCKDQIWTVNELIVEELGISADLDRSKV